MSDARRHILDASLTLIAERGVRGVSFREVARRAGVSHQSPYHHFGNQAGILAALATEGFDALATQMRALSDAADATGDALTGVGLAYLTFAQQNPGHFVVMFDRALQRTAADAPDTAAAWQAASQRTYSVLRGVCDRAVQDGHGRGLSGEDLAHVAWSSVHGLATLLAEGTLAHASHQDADALRLRTLMALSTVLRDG